jgi:hypothetical protein
MSTALSMPSPLSHGTGAFATSLQLSPAFRSLHAAALRQRQSEFERLRELARSDEFSDDESDGDENEELEEDDDDEDKANAPEHPDDEEQDDEDDVVAANALATRAEPTRLSPRDYASDSDIDADETVLLPFIRPKVTGAAASRAPHQAMSPRVCITYLWIWVQEEKLDLSLMYLFSLAGR